MHHLGVVIFYFGAWNFSVRSFKDVIIVAAVYFGELDSPGQSSLRREGSGQSGELRYNLMMLCAS